MYYSDYIINCHCQSSNCIKYPEQSTPGAIRIALLFIQTEHRNAAVIHSVKLHSQTALFYKHRHIDDIR